MYPTYLYRGYKTSIDPKYKQDITLLNKNKQLNSSTHT